MSQRLLFLEKMFTRPRQGPLRGVEIFNLSLIHDLQAMGFTVTIPVLPQWQPVMQDYFGDHMPELLRITPLLHSSAAVWLKFILMRKRTWDAFIIGNVAKSLSPAIRVIMQRHTILHRPVLIAHRESHPAFTALMKKYDVAINAVNRIIAEPFEDGGCSVVAVDYGVKHADQFYPAEEPDKPGDERLHFCVLGALDSAWKGADTAMEAYRMLPADIQKRCVLHLASYAHPPKVLEEGIVIHDWKPVEMIPGFLRRMDVQIVPSRDEHIMRETFSQVMVQGMLTGLPQLVSDLPILKEKLDKGGGWIFQNSRELCSLMRDMAEQPEQRNILILGRQARATALSRYVWDTPTWVARWLPDCHPGSV